MNASNLYKVLAIAACTGGLSYLLTWVARWMAPQLGFVDKPDAQRKLHATATPLLGGTAVYVAFACGSLMLAIMAGWKRIQPADWQFGLALLTSAGLCCVLGIWDDRRPLRARNKFLLQVLATTPFVAFGPLISSIHFMGVGLELGPLATVFTILWLVSCANIVNLMDGLDGLATSVGLIACLTLAVLALLLHNGEIAAVGFIFAACLAGFLIHNWPPAKIFLGDAGSLTIGFVVGALSIGGTLKTATGFVLAFPVVLLSIPILDTLMAILRRKLLGQPIGDADRGHIHHLLLDRGLSKLQTLLAIGGFSIVMATTVIVAGTLQSDLIALVPCFVVVALVITGRVFGFREVDLVFRHVQIIRVVLRNALGLMGARVHFMRAESTDSSDPKMLWSVVESRVEAAGGKSLELTFGDCEDRTGRLAAQWTRQDHAAADDGPTWDIRLSVPRDHGLRATLTASGYCGDNGQEQRVEQLVHVFARVCRSWPEEATLELSLPHPQAVEAGDDAGDDAEPINERRAA